MCMREGGICSLGSGSFVIQVLHGFGSPRQRGEGLDVAFDVGVQKSWTQCGVVVLVICGLVRLCWKMRFANHFQATIPGFCLTGDFGLTSLLPSGVDE